MAIEAFLTESTFDAHETDLAVSPLVFAALLAGCGGSQTPPASRESTTTPRGPAATPAAGSLDTNAGPVQVWNMKDHVTKTEENGRSSSRRRQFQVTRKKGTERAFTGEILEQPRKGRVPVCLLRAGPVSFGHEIRSGTGWPSFYAPITQENVKTESDNTFFQPAHRGAVSALRRSFGSRPLRMGPAPTGLRYCMNSAALNSLRENAVARVQGGKIGGRPVRSGQN
jgi:peptide-methionine (R)-S-oxide reductase